MITTTINGATYYIPEDTNEDWGEYTTEMLEALADNSIRQGSLTGDWDIGDYQVRAKQFYADVATGTAPLVITSTTIVSNLNADQVDGYDLDQDVQTTASPTFVALTLSGTLNMGTGDITNAGAITGTALTIAGSSIDAGGNLTIDGSASIDGTLSMNSQDISSVGIISASDIGLGGELTANYVETTIATGAPPLVVASTTKVTNLNADTVDGYDMDQDVKIAASPTFVNNTLTGYTELTDISAPANPGAGLGRLYKKTGDDGVFWKPDAAGAEVDLTSTGAGDLKADGSVSLTSDWDAGSYKITAEQFESDIVTGTAPFIVASTTKVDNLNADSVDGYTFDQALTTGSTPSFEGAAFTANVNFNNNDLTTVGNISCYKTTISGELFVLTGTGTYFQNTGSAPFSVSSSYKVNNLNADQVDGAEASATPGANQIVIADASGFLHTPSAAPDADYEVANKKYVDDQAGGGDLKADGTVPLTANWDVGAYTITGTQFISDIAIGTSPLVVTSTTKVTNLNADQVDGYDFDQGLTTNDGPTFDTLTVISTIEITGGTVDADIIDANSVVAGVLESEVATGTPPMTIASTTKVANLNADLLDGADASATPTANSIVIADASGFLHTPSAAPDADYEVANKKYVDDNGGSVSSVFTRTGAVVAATNDYTWAQIDKTTSSIADIATKSHTALTDKGTNTHTQIDTHIADDMIHNSETAEYDNGNSSTAKTITWNNGRHQEVDMTGDCTFTFTAPTEIGFLTLRCVQDGTGTRVATFPATVKGEGGGDPILSTTAAAVDIINFYFDGTDYIAITIHNINGV